LLEDRRFVTDHSFMKLILFALLGVGGLVHAQTFTRCTTPEVEPIQRLVIESQLAPFRGGHIGEMLTERPIDIHVIANVISKNQKDADANVTDQAIAAQIDELNVAYRSYAVEFKLDEINRVIEPKWFPMAFGGKHEATMKKKLHRGGTATLNIYFIAMEDETLGWSSFPWDYNSDPFDDGLIIANDTLPGGPRTPYNLGLTAVHEAGHWLGLYHTFQGGCSDGDEVADTPAEKTAAFGCPVNQDTCPDKGGGDPVHNYMDYVDDDCMNELSVGQAQRIHDSWEAYRKQ
jgi:hypothetical protein